MIYMPEEITYRFPYSRLAAELTPDVGDTFRLRLAWQRGKAVLDLFETTPLRPIAEIVYQNETFPLSIDEHRRERRERIVLSAQRHAGTRRALLRADLRLEGREDRFVWDWKIAARSTATRRLLAGRGDIALCLPLRPGRSRILPSPLAERGLCIQRDGVAVTVVLTAGPGRLRVDEEGIRVELSDVPLRGQALRFETRFVAATTESEAHRALLAHLADAADAAQVPQAAPASLTAQADRAAAALMREDVAEKRGVDRLALRAAPGYHVNGEGTHAAHVALALYNRYRFTGDDAEKRRAFLLSRGVCDFQVLGEENTHRGAFWDFYRARKHPEDPRGERTVSVKTTARATDGLHWLHGFFGQKVTERAASIGAQWLLLKMDRAGFYDAERYGEDGRPAGEGSPWACAEAMRPLVETFRRTGNDVFMKAALRVAGGIGTALDGGDLSLESASIEQLCAAIDGVLYISREAEKEELVALARRLGLLLRAWRAPDGGIGERGSDPTLPATLAAARAALALARIDDDLAWPLYALRALRAASARSESELRLTDHAALCSLPAQLLLTLAGRAPEARADRDDLRLMRGWQIFDPDPATRAFLKVTARDADTPVDHLALVCPFNFQVLIVVLAPPDVTTVEIEKNGRRPYLKNLLTGDYDLDASLLPLGTGGDANFGIFVADT